MPNSTRQVELDECIPQELRTWLKDPDKCHFPGTERHLPLGGRVLRALLEKPGTWMTSKELVTRATELGHKFSRGRKSNLIGDSITRVDTRLRGWQATDQGPCTVKIERRQGKGFRAEIASTASRVPVSSCHIADARKLGRPVLQLAGDVHWIECAGDANGLDFECCYDQHLVKLPEAVAGFPQRYARAMKAVKGNGEELDAFNAKRYCLRGLACRQDEGSERPTAVLSLCASTYAHFLSTNGCAADKAANAGIEDACKIVNDCFRPHERTLEELLALGYCNSIGMNLVVICRDDDDQYCTVIVKRSKRTGQRPMCWGVSANEGARRRGYDRKEKKWKVYDQVSKEDPCLDVRTLAKRALKDECGCTAQDKDIHLLCLGYDTLSWQPAILGYVDLPEETFDFIARKVISNAKDKGEAAACERCTFTPCEVARFITRCREEVQEAGLSPYDPPGLLPYAEVALYRAVQAYWTNNHLSGNDIEKPFLDAGLFAPVESGA